MSKKIAIGILVVCITGLYLCHWLGYHLGSNFFFSALDLKLRIIFDIRSDQTTLPLVARIFHNKLTQGSVDIFNAYFHFFDIRFLLFLLSPLTLFGLALKCFYLVKEKAQLNGFEKILTVLILLVPLILLFHLISNLFLGLLIFAIPLLVLSISGFFIFFQRQKYAWIYGILIAGFSLWYLLILGTMIVNFCQV